MRALLLLALLVPVAAAAPEQIHLGVPSSDPAHEISVLWLDDTPEQGASVTLDTPEGPKTFPAATVQGPSVGNAYEAKLTGLALATAYRYHIAGREFSFTTAPANASNFTFVALGDMGVTAASQSTEKAIETLQPDFVLHSGDISYAESRQNEWIQWFNLVEPVAATRPWITALGNHETYTESSLTEATSFVSPDARIVSPVEIAFYHQRFALPGNELWYSFDWGGAHFVALDTFSEAQIPADEIAWLEQDLTAHSDARWTIAFLHEPPYSSGTTHGSSARVQTTLVPILEKHHVDLVLAGHEHNYERTWPLESGVAVTLLNESLRGQGTVYLVSGGGGESTYPFAEKLGNFTSARSSSYHVTAIRVSPDAIEGRYVGTDGGTFADAFRIQHDPTPVEQAPPTPEMKTPGPAISILILALATGATLRRAQNRG